MIKNKYHPISLGVTIISLLLMITIGGCKKEDMGAKEGPIGLPTLAIDSTTSITQSSAEIFCNIISNGGIRKAGKAMILASGVCWDTVKSPTVKSNLTTNGPLMGSFSSSITGLNPFTTYYVRAYATNAVGTAYSDEVYFTTTGPLAVLTTDSVTDITGTTATCGGIITAHGETVTSQGVCWSSVDTPTVADSKTMDVMSGTTFTSNLTGLEPGVTYNVRAYAINPAGVAYGNTITFTTTLPTVQDYDGNVYHQVRVGNQIWMKENLKVTHFRNGDPIPDLFNLNSDYVSVYGRLYTGFDATDSRNIAPPGWHVPTDQDWETLATYVVNNGGMLKETGTTHWTDPNVGATNQTGFTALPGGLDGGSGPDAVGAAGFWWTSTSASSTDLWRWAIVNNDIVIFHIHNDKSLGFSIRLIKN